jgi:formimidoylglutamate deiminase
MIAERLHAANALLPTGWARDVLLEWDDRGDLVSVTPGTAAEAGVPREAGPVVPGMPNLHSHAFQRAFAGLTEFRGNGDDSFWSWRALMYRFAAHVTPDQLEAIATWVYIEMLIGGYTSVCEFHYLHNDADGRPYADDATLALCLVRAARRAGIGLTLLPVLYQQGGFGGVPPADGQRRFLKSTESLLGLAHALQPVCAEAGARLGLAIHSLRAVAPPALADVLSGFDALDASAPRHIHVAEQTREVAECVAWSGQRPVEWLLNHVPVDARWCLVHATHMTGEEAGRAARTGAVAGLCPTTEANLGDGTFDLERWTAPATHRPGDAQPAEGPGAGKWGVGSDSHITVDAADELRMLEYSQRLSTGRRNVAASPDQPHVATAMTLAAVAGGAAAAGRNVAGLAVGQRADFVVLDAQHPLIAGLPAPGALDAHVFASHGPSPIATVVVGGREVVQQGRHEACAGAAEGFRTARLALLARA